MASPARSSPAPTKPSARTRTTRGRTWEGRVGELAVYPGHGVTRIEALQKREIGGGTLEVLVLRKLEDGSRILIPRKRIAEVGLRPVIKRKEAGQIWEILRNRKTGRRKQGMPWSRQFKEFQDKLREGTIFDTAEVLRDLLMLQHKKELSFGERKLLESARSLLVQELAAAQKAEPDEIEAEIRAAVK